MTFLSFYSNNTWHLQPGKNLCLLHHRCRHEAHPHDALFIKNMQSILFIQSCSLPLTSFPKPLPKAYSSTFVFPLPFPQIFPPPLHCSRSKHVFGKQGENLKWDKKKCLNNITFPESSVQNYIEEQKLETKPEPETRLIFGSSLILIMYGDLDTQGALFHGYVEVKTNFTIWIISYTDCRGSFSRQDLVDSN